MRRELPLSTLPALGVALLLGLSACADRGAGDAAPSPAASQPAVNAPADDVAPEPAPEPAETTAGPATFAGFADAEFGMDPEQVRAVWDGELKGGPVEGAGAEGARCFHLNPVGQAGIAYFAMMFGDGKFVRYSVSNDDIVAPGGGRRGMDDAEIARLYGEGIERQPHKYVDGEYLRIHDPSGSDAVLVFETDADGTVTEWRVGLPPQIDYVEGCG